LLPEDTSLCVHFSWCCYCRHNIGVLVSDHRIIFNNIIWILRNDNKHLNALKLKRVKLKVYLFFEWVSALVSRRIPFFHSE
jgi:hypothetical protein